LIVLIVKIDVCQLYILQTLLSCNIYWSFKQPLQEPEKMTKIIIQALEKTGQRGVINRGWGGLGSCESWFLLKTCHWYTIYAYL